MIFTWSTQLVFTGFLNHQQHYQQLLMIRFFKSYQLGWPKLLAAWRSDVFLTAISTVRALWLWTKRVWLRCLPQESSKSLLFCVGGCFIMFHPPDLFTHSQGHWVLVCSITFSLCLILFFVDYKCWTNSFNQRFRGQPRFPMKLQLIIQRLHNTNIQIIFTLQLSKSSTKAPWSKMINVIHRPFLALMRSLIGHNLCCLSGRCPEGESEHQIASTRGSTWIHYCWWFRNPANQLIGSLSHYLHGFIHPRWLAGFLPSTVWF